MARRQIAHRGFIDLHVTRFEHFRPQVPVDRLQPVADQLDPAGEGLPRKFNVVALFENMFLSIQGKMIGVFADHHLGQQTGGGQATFLQAGRQRRGDRRHILVGAMDERAADGAAPQKTRGLVIQLFGDFLADAAPGFRLRLHRLGVDDFLDDGQVFGQPGLAFGLGPRQRHHDGFGWQRRFVFDGRLAPGQGEQQLQLTGREFLAAAPEHAAGEQINLLPEQLNLVPRRRQLRFQFADSGLELGGAGVHSGRCIL
jgi:hypothetical protein